MSLMQQLKNRKDQGQSAPKVDRREPDLLRQETGPEAYLQSLKDQLASYPEIVRGPTLTIKKSSKDAVSGICQKFQQQLNFSCYIDALIEVVHESQELEETAIERAIALRQERNKVQQLKSQITQIGG